MVSRSTTQKVTSWSRRPSSSKDRCASHCVGVLARPLAIAVLLMSQTLGSPTDDSCEPTCAWSLCRPERRAGATVCGDLLSVSDDEHVSVDVDILLPFYGDVTLMKETVGSVQRQSDPEWRLIVVDDHQPDTSVPSWFASIGDERIEYHRNNRNIGANANYRKALSLSESDYVVFLGADDRLLPQYLALARSRIAMASPAVAMYHPDVRVIGEDGNAVRTGTDTVKRLLRPRSAVPMEIGGERLMTRLMLGNWTYFPAICWRRTAIEAAGFRPQFNVVQDLALMSDLALSGYALLVDTEVTFEYRRHSRSDSSVRSLSGERFDEEDALHREVAQLCASRGWSGASRASRLRPSSRVNALATVPKALRAQDGRAARQLVRHAFR